MRKSNIKKTKYTTARPAPRAKAHDAEVIMKKIIGDTTDSQKIAEKVYYGFYVLGRMILDIDGVEALKTHVKLILDSAMKKGEKVQS